MKKVLMLCVVVLFFTCVANTGCTFSGGDIVLPDVSSFSIRGASTFVPGDSLTITVLSSTLTPGQYTLHYNLTGANVSQALSTLIIINNDSGSFSTPALTNPGNTTLNVGGITTSSGGNANIQKNNTLTFTDSIGLMTALINDTGAYKAFHVTATLTGTLLTIKGTYWSPLKTITLNVDNYVGASEAIYFNAGNSTSANGSALDSNVHTTDTAQHGVITITHTSPLLTGTFSFTNKDSTTVSNGTFSCVSP